VTTHGTAPYNTVEHSVDPCRLLCDRVRSLAMRLVASVRRAVTETQLLQAAAPAPKRVRDESHSISGSHRWAHHIAPVPLVVRTVEGISAIAESEFEPHPIQRAVPRGKHDLLIRNPGEQLVDQSACHSSPPELRRDVYFIKDQHGTTIEPATSPAPLTDIIKIEAAG
jgi:hypothetical protein